MGGVAAQRRVGALRAGIAVTEITIWPDRCRIVVEIISVNQAARVRHIAAQRDREALRGRSCRASGPGDPLGNR